MAKEPGPLCLSEIEFVTWKYFRIMPRLFDAGLMNGSWFSWGKKKQIPKK